MKIYWSGQAWCGEDVGILRRIVVEGSTIVEVIESIALAKKDQKQQWKDRPLKPSPGLMALLNEEQNHFGALNQGLRNIF